MNRPTTKRRTIAGPTIDVGSLDAFLDDIEAMAQRARRRGRRTSVTLEIVPDLALALVKAARKGNVR